MRRRTNGCIRCLRAFLVEHGEREVQQRLLQAAPVTERPQARHALPEQVGRAREQAHVPGERARGIQRPRVPPPVTIRIRLCQRLLAPCPSLPVARDGIPEPVEVADDPQRRT